MARMTVKGTDEYALKLSKLEAKTGEVAGKAIYGAADIVADAIRANIEALPSVDDKFNIFAFRKGKNAKLSEKQKAALLESFGITPMDIEKNGYYNVKLGFDGYNSIRTRTYPKGQPNQMIARAVESGSPYMEKMPFVRPAVNSSRKQAVQKMQEVIDDAAGNIME